MMQIMEKREEILLNINETGKNDRLTENKQSLLNTENGHRYESLEIERKQDESFSYAKNEIEKIETFKETIIENHIFKKNKIQDILNKTKRHGLGFENFRKIFLEWSLLTKFDCYSKIYEYQSKTCRVIWLSIFLAFVSMTAWLVDKNVSDYTSYEILTKTEIIYEMPAEFPTITLCDKNAFKTKTAEDFVRNILNDYVAFLGFDNNTINLLGFEIYQSVKELAKMNASARTNSIDFKQSLGLSLSAIDKCQFPLNNVCTRDLEADGLNFVDFHWYWSYDYGNCWQFNSGLNYTNNEVPLKATLLGGKQYGLSLTLTGLSSQNSLPTSFSSGMIVFVHNHSYFPMSIDGVAIETGKETIISVQKTLTYNEPSPYTECQDLSEFKSDLYTFIVNSNLTYTQSYCYDLCFQRAIIDTCKVFMANIQ
jgi:hypothetical protein